MGFLHGPSQPLLSPLSPRPPHLQLPEEPLGHQVM